MVAGLFLFSQGKDEREPEDESADERLRRRAYERGCQRLKKRIEGEVLFIQGITRCFFNANPHTHPAECV